MEVKRGRPAGSKNKPKSPESMSGTRSAENGMPSTDLPCNTPGKKRRMSTGQFDVPASARKEAALRTSTGALKSSDGRRRGPSQLSSSSCSRMAASDSSNTLNEATSKSIKEDTLARVQRKNTKRKRSSVSSDGIENESSMIGLQMISEGDSLASSDDDSVYFCSSSSSVSSSQDDFAVEISLKSRKKTSSSCVSRRSVRRQDSSSSNDLVVLAPALKVRSLDKSKRIPSVFEAPGRRTHYSRQARSYHSTAVSISKRWTDRVDSTVTVNSSNASSRSKRKAVTLS